MKNRIRNGGSYEILHPQAYAIHEKSEQMQQINRN
jgi:hypothetical protein